VTSAVNTPPGEFAGRAALITGASRGIGLAIAHSVVGRGARAVITGRHADTLAGAAAALGGPDHAIPVAGNAADPEHRETAVRTAVSRLGGLDMLVANVGINPVYGPLMETDLGAVTKILETNVVATLGLIQQAWHAWMASHGGSVLIVASTAGLRAAEGIAAYGVSKAALINLTTQLAVELGPGVRVNAIAPAVVKTRFAEALYAGREEEVSRRYPSGRLGRPEDAGEAGAYLLGPGAGWVTGQVLVLDGGALSRGPT
jgi:NAD(P)-dependent dehydrogenase (short-subunit alcohol dehydrogenase family)